MDRIEALVAIAHLRLRLEMLVRRPELVRDTAMVLQIKKPIELVGLKSRLIRVDAQQRAIGEIGKRYDKVLDGIDELTAAHIEHVGALEGYEKDLRSKIEGMVGSNGGPLDDTLQSGQESGQTIASETSKA